jgi:hypothetical protein
MKRVWVKKLKSFKLSEQFNLDYYLSMSPQERLEIMQFLREMVFKFKKDMKHGKGRKGLRRIIKIIQ